jgi:hypothetical protein
MKTVIGVKGEPPSLIIIMMVVIIRHEPRASEDPQPQNNAHGQLETFIQCHERTFVVLFIL